MEWDLWPGLVRFHTVGDGNCFFHAVLNSVYDDYKQSNIFEKIRLARNFRTDLISVLEKNYYLLSRGKLADFALGFPEYSLQALTDLLKSNHPVDNIFIELISNYLDLDIYLLDSEKKTLYITGSDQELLIKNRKSILILVSPGHYDSVGLQNQTIFQPDHPLIMKLSLK